MAFKRLVVCDQCGGGETCDDLVNIAPEYWAVLRVHRKDLQLCSVECVKDAIEAEGAPDFSPTPGFTLPAIRSSALTPVADRG